MERNPIPTTPAFWAPRRDPLSLEGLRVHPCKLGELRWSATVSRSGKSVARMSLRRGSDIYRITESAKTVKEWLQAIVPECCFATLSVSPGRENIDGRTWARDVEEPRGTTALTARSDAAFEDRTPGGRCRLGRVIGLAPPTLRVPCHILRRRSKFTRKPVKSSLGEVQCTRPMEPVKLQVQCTRSVK